jgi:hypothetical protein
MLDHHEPSIPRGLKLSPGQGSATWQSELYCGDLTVGDLADEEKPAAPQHSNDGQ